MNTIANTLPTTENEHQNRQIKHITPNSYNSHIQRDYSGARERVLHEKELLECYEVSRQFFKDRENYHHESATWYFNHSVEMENKGYKHIDLAEKAYQQARDYLDLIAMAVLKTMGRV